MLSYEEIKRAIEFICGNETNNLCRLCFAPTTESNVCLDDVVTVSGAYFEEISFHNILKALGISSDVLPETLCENCATSSITNYIFYKQYQLSTEKWRKIANYLSENLLQCYLKPHVQTAYLMLNKDDSNIFTTYIRCHKKNKKTALVKLKGILKRQKCMAKKTTIVKISSSPLAQKFDSKKILTDYAKDNSKSFHICSKCSKCFSSSLLLKQHYDRLHSPKILECNICLKKYSTHQQLRLHIGYYHKPVSCKLCNVMFRSRLNLRTHLNNHDMHKCTTCRKIFMNRNTYRRHIKLCNKDTLQFICDICKKVYSQKSSLKSHLITDHGFGKVISCKWCDKKYDAVSKLKSHILKHTKEKNFICVHCGLKFVSRPALIYHTRIHTGEKPYVCEICGARFLSSSRRMAHKRWKHFEPTKECGVCNMKFVTKYDLRKHNKRHLNPKSRLYTPVFSVV